MSVVIAASVAANVAIRKNTPQYRTLAQRQADNAAFQAKMLRDEQREQMSFWQRLTSR